MRKEARGNKAKPPPPFFYRLISVQYDFIPDLTKHNGKKTHQKIRLIKNHRSPIWPRLSLARLYLFYESQNKKHAKKSASRDYEALFHI